MDDQAGKTIFRGRLRGRGSPIVNLGLVKRFNPDSGTVQSFNVQPAGLSVKDGIADGHRFTTPPLYTNEEGLGQVFEHGCRSTGRSPFYGVSTGEFVISLTSIATHMSGGL